MKKSFLFLIPIVAFSFCTSPQDNTSEKGQNNDSISYTDLKDKSFEELYKEIIPTDISDNVFKLVGEDYSVITAGTDSAYNTMTASWGGWGQLFNKPTTWCILNGNRYTLEFIQKEKTYTMSYFPDQFKEQVLFFGSKSGKGTDKMKENTLSFVKTPSGNIAYKEARMIIECKLVEVTEVNPNDFHTEEGKSFIEKGLQKETGKGYHKLVFGEITKVWVRK